MSSSATRRDGREPCVLKRLLQQRNAVTFLQQPFGHPGVMRVLLVEDHAKLAMALASGLRQAGMSGDVVFDGNDALEHLAVTRYDVVVLDRDIPAAHRDDVCEALAVRA